MKFYAKKTAHNKTVWTTLDTRFKIRRGCNGCYILTDDEAVRGWNRPFDTLREAKSCAQRQEQQDFENV